jgi:hypothetical protein
MPPIIIGNNIEKMDRQFPLTSKFQLKILLQEWLETDGNTIGEMHDRNSNPEPWIWICINNNFYKMHADSNREGVKEFLKNEANNRTWLIIPTKNLGNRTKVTNNLNGNPISGFYMYKVS